MGKLKNCLECKNPSVKVSSHSDTPLNYFCDDDCYYEYQDDEENKVYFTYKEKIYMGNHEFDDEYHNKCDGCDKVGKLKEFELISEHCYRCFMKLEIFIGKYQHEESIKGDK